MGVPTRVKTPLRNLDFNFRPTYFWWKKFSLYIRSSRYSQRGSDHNANFPLKIKSYFQKPVVAQKQCQHFYYYRKPFKDVSQNRTAHTRQKCVYWKKACLVAYSSYTHLRRRRRCRYCWLVCYKMQSLWQVQSLLPVPSSVNFRLSERRFVKNSLLRWLINARLFSRRYTQTGCYASASDKRIP